VNNHASVAVKARKGSASQSAASPIRASDSTIRRMVGVLKLLADESRLRIVLALAQEGEMHVSALCALLGSPAQPVSQPAVSHHLTLMRIAGLVGYRRDGKHNYYHLTSGFMRDLFEQYFADSGNGQKTLQFDDFALTFKRK
jgi:ArsR family transcriptional regulator